MDFDSPIDAAFTEAMERRKPQLSEVEIAKINTRTKEMTRELIECWENMRKHPEDSRRYRKADEKSDKLIDDITDHLRKLSIFNPRWFIDLKEKFESNPY